MLGGNDWRLHGSLVATMVASWLFGSFCSFDACTSCPCHFGVDATFIDSPIEKRTLFS